MLSTVNRSVVAQSTDCNTSGVPDHVEMDAFTWRQTVAPNDAAVDDEFGAAVSLSGVVGLVGSPHDDDRGTSSGAAYIFFYNGANWVQAQKLIPTDLGTNDQLGTSVSLTNGYALIGAPRKDGPAIDAGAAYVYRWNGNTWVQQQKLTATDAAAQDEFGIGVSIAPGVALIGAHWDDVGGSNGGSAYVFRLNGTTWAFEQKLQAADAAAGDEFGRDVAVDGGVALVGAPFDDDLGADSGAAYVFRYSGTQWVQEQKITPSDGASGDNFGFSVSLHGDTALIGARSDDDRGLDSGSAYVFRFDGATWVQEAKLLASDGAADDRFGRAVSVRGDTAVVGAVNKDLGASNTGAAYLFRRDGTTWYQTQRLTPHTPAAGDQFGYSVSLGATELLVGARFDEVGVSNSGTIQAFRLVTQDCNTNATLDVCEPGCNTNGIPDECEILGGAADCDTNGVLDVCQSDCNTNNLADPCDAAAGADCNNNDIPDVCETNGREQQRFVPAGTALADRVGHAIAARTDEVFIGAPQRDTSAGADAGAVFLYGRANNAWLYRRTLSPSDPAPADQFGHDVGMDDDVALIGAPWKDHAGYLDIGAGYVFRRVDGEWIQEQKLVPPNLIQGMMLGYTVGIHGDVAALVATFDSEHSSVVTDPAVWVYRRTGDTWNWEQIVWPQDGQIGDRFGAALSVNADVILVSSLFTFTPGHPRGAAYVFRWNGSAWQFEQKLISPDGPAGAYFDFGRSVAIHGDEAIVGAPSEAQGGAAYVFRRANGVWSFHEKLEAPAGQSGERFGSRIAIDSDRLLIADYSRRSGGVNIGAVFLYVRYGDSWILEQEYRPWSSQTAVWSGTSLALAASEIWVGARNDNGAGIGAGSAYLLVNQFDCNNNNLPDECEPDCNGNAIPDACERPGDINGDGFVDVDDVPAMIELLLVLSSNCWHLGDLDQNGIVDGDDIAPFLEALMQQ